MYLRELYDLSEEIVVKQVGQEWQVFDTDTNRALAKSKSKDQAERAAQQITATNQRRNPGQSQNNNQNPPANQNPPDPNKHQNIKRKLGKPQVQHLGKNKFKITTPDGVSYTGAANEVVDKLITHTEGIDPRRAARMQRSRKVYIRFVQNSLKQSRALSWFIKFMNVAGAHPYVMGTGISAGMSIHSILTTAADLRFLREYANFGAHGDPTTKIISDMVTETGVIIASHLTRFILSMGKNAAALRKLSTLLSAGALVMGPIGWILVILKEFAIQGAIMALGWAAKNYMGDFVDRMLGEHLTRIVFELSKQTDVFLGKEQLDTEQEETDINEVMAANQENVETVIRNGIESDEVPESENSKLEKTMDIFRQRYFGS